MFADGTNFSQNTGPSPAFVDLDGDGDLDMICAWKNGEVKTYINVSATGMATFAKGEFLKAGEEALSSNDGRPFIADWDTDGTPDLVMGSEGTGVFWMKGNRVEGKLAFGEPNSLVEQRPRRGWEPREPANRKTMVLNGGEIGARPAPAVVDWNGDGKLDLLVGDFATVKPVQKKITPAQQNELRRIRAEERNASNEMIARMQSLMSATEKATGIRSNEIHDPAQRIRFGNELAKLSAKDKRLQALRFRVMELNRRAARLETPPYMTGFVWVFLRK